MFRKYILPLVALAGVVFAIFTVLWGDKTRPPVPPVSEAAQSPYPSSVAGSGIVEASTENISIGTPIESARTHRASAVMNRRSLLLFGQRTGQRRRVPRQMG